MVETTRELGEDWAETLETSYRALGEMTGGSKLQSVGKDAEKDLVG